MAQHLLNDRADAYAHGVCWVELANVGDGTALPQRIADALGVRGAAGEPLAELCAAVSTLTMLVALDNAEHLLGDVARIAAALLDAAPRLRLIVTSQAPLRSAAESIYRVGPLLVPDGPLPSVLAQTFAAVALFVERARSADAHFVLSDDSAPAAIDLCRVLDGMPLAIELAAARAPLLGVTQLAASMSERLRLLTRNRDATAPARQQTLRAALEWSHGLLDERERIVFRRLGVFEGSASLDRVQQVVAVGPGPLDAWAVLGALGSLVDRSLVMVLDDDADHGLRYRLLESPRLLARELLRAAGEDEAVKRRHALALAAAYDAAWDERWSGRIGAKRWGNHLLHDASNAREAIAWARSAGESETVASIAATLYMALPRSTHVERMALADLCESLAEQVPASTLRRGRIARAHAELESLETLSWPAQRLAWGLSWVRWIPLTRTSGADQAAQTLAVTRRWIRAVEAAGDDTAHCIGSLLDAELECGQRPVNERGNSRVRRWAILSSGAW